ncbi:MAG: hypothetical protein R3E79_17770 [Caldilineaceae bacterium]
MANSQRFMIGIMLAVLLVGVSSLVLSYRQAPATHTIAAQVTTIPPISAMPLAQATARPIVNNTATSSGTSLPTPSPTARMTATFSPTPTPAVTPQPVPVQRQAPEVPVPANGHSYQLTPVSAGAVGWVRTADEVINHLGDYNIYAGRFEDHNYIGALQFDLSAIPPGSPIIHADLTFTGLSDEWLGEDGVWSVQILEPWLDETWATNDFHWLARLDSGASLLTAPATATELGIGKVNTFFFTPEGLATLAARLFTGTISLRVNGPSDGGDNLFSWDSGYGSRSLGQAPILYLVTGPAPAEPPPTPTPNYVIMTPAPEGAALVALADHFLTATAQAPVPDRAGTPTATPTALPPNWVTPVVITATPTPENQATAVWVAQIATAQAVVHGTATPLPPNVWTATPTPAPTATPLLLAYELLTPTPLPTLTPGAIPAIVRGRILFYTDRNGQDQLMVMDPDGSNVALWTGDEWLYTQTKQTEDLSPDGQFRVVVSAEQVVTHQLWRINLNDGKRFQLTHFERLAYDAVWSPRENRIAFVSPEPGNDEIFTIYADGNGLTQVTHNDWEWDKHPSWSPDGNQIVFWSNRETQRKQLWLMNADGSNPRNISNNPYNDWNPVWVK